MKDQYKSWVLNQIVSPAGEAILHSQMPDDFELYLIALQVVDDENNNIEDFMLFPVNPNSAMQIQKSFTNIKKSFNAVHVNENDSFVPMPINLTGNFGRKLRIIVTGNSSIPMKTGYGAIKYLKNLILLSKSSNANGKPLRTILYNLAFGEIYTVEINECRFSQSVEQSRIWNYDLNMTAVAPGDIGNTNFNLKLEQLIVFNVLNNNILSSLVGLIP